MALAPTTIKATFGILGNPFTYNAAVPISEGAFKYAFGNHLGVQESRVLWERYAVPGAAHVC